MRSYFPFRGGVLAALALSFSSPAAAQQPATADRVVELPEFTVTDSPVLAEPESWRYAQVGTFEVLSNASDRNTQRLLRDFQLFTQAMRLVWPTPVKPLAASSLILCGRGAQFDTFLPAGGERADLTTSILLRDREQVAIVADLEADRIALDPTKVVTDAAGVEYEVDHYRQLYRQYVRFLLTQSEARVPVWLEEGVAQIVMDIQLDSRTLLYGKVDTYRGTESGGASSTTEETDATADAGAVIGEQPFNAVLRFRKMMPFDRFFAIAADDPAARSPLGNNLWSKQAYAFVHFCLFGEDLRHQAGLQKLVTRLAREPMSEALFKECFGTDYAGMHRQLRAYILHVRHKYQKYDLRQSDVVANEPVALREATQAEIGRIKGDARRLAGLAEGARAEYRAAYIRGERDPRLLAALGLSELAEGRRDRARALLENATKAGVSRPSAYVALARLRLEDFRAAGAAQLDQAQMAAVLTPLFQARARPPALPETYALIAEAWSLSAIPPRRDHLAVLDEGVRTFPRDTGLVLAAARLNARIGENARASEIAVLGLRFASEPALRRELEPFVAAVPAQAPAR